jgi:hypothetical protein
MLRGTSRHTASPVPGELQKQPGGVTRRALSHRRTQQHRGGDPQLELALVLSCTTHTHTHAHTHRYLVFSVCPGKSGLGDRIRGMMYVTRLAVAAKRVVLFTWQNDPYEPQRCVSAKRLSCR